MSYDPAAQKTTNDAALVARIFGSKGDAREAQKVATLNPQLYASLKKDAAILGLIAEPQPWQDKDYRRRFEPRQFTAREFELRAKYSEQYVKVLLTGTAEGPENAAKIAKEDPTRWAEIREAGVSYGILEKAPPKPEKAPAPTPEHKFELAPDICSKLSLPKGHLVTMAEFEQITQLLHDAQQREFIAKADTEAQKQADAAAEQAKKTAELEAIAAAVREHDRRTLERSPLAALAGAIPL